MLAAANPEKSRRKIVVPRTIDRRCRLRNSSLVKLIRAFTGRDFGWMARTFNDRTDHPILSIAARGKHLIFRVRGFPDIITDRGRTDSVPWERLFNRFSNLPVTGIL
jgi:hypothetical protein